MQEQQPNPLKSLLSRLIAACHNIHMEKPRAHILSGLEKVVEDAEFFAQVEQGKREQRSRSFAKQQQRIQQRREEANEKL